MPKHKIEDLGLGTSWSSRWFWRFDGECTVCMTAVYPWCLTFVGISEEDLYGENEDDKADKEARRAAG